MIVKYPIRVNQENEIVKKDFDEEQNYSIENNKLDNIIKQKPRMDPIQFILAASIFIFLSSSVYILLGKISLIAMGVGAIITIYQFVESTRKQNSHSSKKHRPSIFLLFLICSPFIVASLVILEGVSLFKMEPFSFILLWALMFTFWSTFMFVPMAVASKHREGKLPNLRSFPKVSIIIPAYNEEKVIQQTINALLESKYPKKEIIFVDDGSLDNTLSIATKYNDKIKVLHKENGGKASALNYGLVYATGDIIVIVDADTVIGRHAIREIVKGFETNEDIAAVAGNIKVRNRVNWITKCQALEYIIGIQIIRRAFDTYGSVTIVPGALGGFKKSFLKESGAYTKDTIVEDFDLTIKILKAGLTTQGSSKAIAYTEAPTTLNDFSSQRRRWYRGNIQVVNRHSDALVNPRFGHLHKLTFPYMIIGMFVTPIIGFTAMISAIMATVLGDGLFVAQFVGIFTVVHILTTALAIRIDGEDPKLLWHAMFLVFGYKQIVDALTIRAIFEQLKKKKAVWTSANRVDLR
jgi:poly-beta-1,6 N-acetyl-D-glucosamine synthase